MLLIVLAGCGPKPIGAVLTYQAEIAAEDVELEHLIDQLVSSVNHRLGRSGEAKKLEGDQLEVSVYGDVDQAQLEVIKRLVSSMGMLEFRITADTNVAADK
jgi:hypothetical protein